MMRTTIYTGTPTLSVRDNRNQVVRTLNYNRRDIRQLAEVLIERQLTSDDGRHSQQWDARLFDLWQNDDTVSPNLHTRPSLAGQALRSDSVDAGWSVALYDAAGRIVWAEDGRGTRSRTEFDQLGRPRAAYLQVGEEVERVAERCIYGDTDGSMPDPSSYNARGQLVRHYHDAGLQAAPSYSLQGAALREQCQLLPSAEALSDWQGENESAWQDELAPQVYTTTHEYDALGGALAQTDARGNLQRWSYDVAGLLSQSFLTLSGGSEQILLKQQSWSAAGQKLQETAGNDVATSYSYEPQTQRLVRIETRRADLSVLQDLSYGYDPVGNVIWQENAVVATRYFANQAVKARNDFQYDALYQLMSASGRENANAGIQGPALPEAMPDTSNLVNYTRSYAYDDGGNLLRIQHTGALSYSNEIVVGSRSNRALAQDSNSPITPEQIDDYFDANGNVLRMQPGTPLGWNERNQLQRVVLVDRGTEQDNDREVYQYRQGLRVRKQTRRLIDSASQRWDIQEAIYLPGLELRSRYVEQAGEPQAPSEELHVATPAQGGRAQVRVLHWVVGKPADITNDQVRYGLGDQIGSLQLELDNSGLVISQEEYYPFGGTAVLAARSATEVAYKVVRYSGQERDGTGLYYYGYRYYAPWLGRWLNPDPAGLVDGLNVYRMVRNNPVTLRDLMGLMPPKKDPANRGRGAAINSSDNIVVNIYTEKYQYKGKGRRKGETIEGNTITDILTYEDAINGKARLNIAGHGSYVHETGFIIESSFKNGIMLNEYEAAKNKTRKIYDMNMLNAELVRRYSNNFSSQSGSKFKVIRLVSCYAGKYGKNSGGQELANLTGIPVQAYAESLFFSNLSLIGKGEYIEPALDAENSTPLWATFIPNAKARMVASLPDLTRAGTITNNPSGDAPQQSMRSGPASRSSHDLSSEQVQQHSGAAATTSTKDKGFLMRIRKFFNIKKH